MHTQPPDPSTHIYIHPQRYIVHSRDKKQRTFVHSNAFSLSLHSALRFAISSPLRLRQMTLNFLLGSFSQKVTCGVIRAGLHCKVSLLTVTWFGTLVGLLKPACANDLFQGKLNFYLLRVLIFWLLPPCTKKNCIIGVRDTSLAYKRVRAHMNTDDEF